MIRHALAVLMLTAASGWAAAAEIAASATEIRPILLGSKLPDVALRTLEGEATTLARQVGGKPAILVFYRGGWCPYCNLQLSDLRLIEDRAKALGYQMIAISPDRPEELAKTLDAGDLTYTLLSDSQANAMKASARHWKKHSTNPTGDWSTNWKQPWAAKSNNPLKKCVPAWKTA